MDLWAFITSTTGLVLLGLAIALIGYGYIELGWTGRSKRMCRFIGVAMVALGVLSWAGIPLLGEEEAPTQETVGSFTVTGSESESFVSLDQVAKKFVIAVNFSDGGDTFNGGTGEFDVNFTVQRGLGTVGLVQTYGDVKTIPSVTASSGDSYPIISKTSDQYNADWTRADLTTANKMVTITIAEDADGAEVMLTITLNADAVAEMDQYEAVDIGVLIGGENWTIEVLKSIVTA
jgi:hypothetical protein